MNLLFRFFIHIFLAKISPTLNANEPDQVQLTVLPNDLDLNIHLNNGRFLSIMDLGRTRLSIRTGLYDIAKTMGWGNGVVGGIAITYLKSLSVFQRYTLCTKLAGHYNGWLYIEQRFESRGQLVAAALVKVTFLKGGKRVSAQDLIEAMEVEEIGENKDYLEHLFNSEKEFLNYIKKDYS
jgi:acyl-CoA thioesterase FadM